MPALQLIFNDAKSDSCSICLNLGPSNVGWISSLVYFGNMAGSPFAGYFLSNYSPKIVMFVTTLISVACYILFNIAT